MCSLVRNLKHTAVQPQASQKVERHPLCEPLPIRAPSSLLEFCDNSFLAFFGVWVISKKLKFLYSKAKVKSLSRVRLFATPWTVAYEAPLSMGFSSQEYWSGFSPVDLPDPGETLQWKWGILSTGPWGNSPTLLVLIQYFLNGIQ